MSWPVESVTLLRLRRLPFLIAANQEIVKEWFRLLLLGTPFICLFLDKLDIAGQRNISLQISGKFADWGRTIFWTGEDTGSLKKGDSNGDFCKNMTITISENSGEKNCLMWSGPQTSCLGRTTTRNTSFLFLAKWRKLDYKTDPEGTRSFPEWERKQSKIRELSCPPTCKDKKEIKKRKKILERLLHYQRWKIERGLQPKKEPLYAKPTFPGYRPLKWKVSIQKNFWAA